MLSTILFLALAADPTPPGQIAFMRSGRVWLINADGTGERALTDELPLKADRPVTWMPDGNKLLYWHHSKIGWDIWSVNADGTGHVNLTKVEKGGCRSPAPSPDGKFIAFMRDDPEGMFVMNADGSKLRQLTDGGHRDGTPSWSPDGMRLLYTKIENDNSVIYQYDLSTKRDLRIAKGDSPTWSPRGKGLLAFIERGTTPTVRFGTLDQDQFGIGWKCWPAIDPAWSPVAEEVAYLRQFAKQAELRLFEHRFEGQLALAILNGRAFAPPNWSSDGQWLTCCAGLDNKPKVYVIHKSGPIRTIGGDGAWFPAWRPTPKPAVGRP